MKLIEYCLKNPVVVSVGVIFLLLFGSIALLKMPYQLLPQVTRPVISIYTSYAGATPYEVEKEITDRQEKYLKNIPNLTSMTSTSRDGMSIINLEFDINADMKLAFLNVSAKLDEVRGYPPDIDKPIIKTTGDNIPIAVYLFVKTAEGNNESINHYKNFIYDEVIKYYERLNGVGEVYVSGGTSKQIQIILDAKKLAYNNITIDEVIQAIKIQNTNISAGSIDFDQRNYRISTIGQYQDIASIYNTIIKSEGNKVILLKNVASILKGYENTTGYNIHNNDNVISLQIRPTASANILSLTKNVQELTDRLNNTIIKGEHLHIDWGRDQRNYIESSISQVKENILIGIVLATLILYLFLRNFSSLIVVALIIPVSVIGSFILLEAFGRTLNVVSLAGISFAISMIIDSAIVVMANIIAHKDKTKNLFEAASLGTKEVIGALFASTITTIAIFIPIALLNDEAGQLFVDIALAASSSIFISFFVCIFVIPPFALLMLKKLSSMPKIKINVLITLNNTIEKIGERISSFLLKILKYCVQSTLSRSLTIIIFVGICSIFSFLAFPKTDYLPKGSQNFIIAYLNPPSGLSLSEKDNIIKEIYEDFKPFLQANNYEQKSPSDLPVIKDFFISSGTNMYFYLSAKNPDDAPKLIPYAQSVIDSIPNITGIVLQQGIFSASGSSSIDINVSGSDLYSLLNTAQEIVNSIKKNLSDVSVRTVPSLEINNREINLYPDSRALALNGLDVRSFGTIVEVMLEGKKISQYKSQNGKNVDLVLKTYQNKSKISPEDILYSQIYTPNGGILSLNSLATIKNELGVSRIRHFEQNRNILIILNSYGGQPLEEIMDKISNIILPDIEKNTTDNIFLSGSAGKLSKLKGELLGGFLLAIVITYLILCALYGNFIYPFIIILTVPFATTGGLIGLYLLNRFLVAQNLDVITMLGFIILVGSVVNNAILIVYQTLINFKEYKIPAFESVIKATQSRLSPIYMSMLTSVFGLLPLVLFAGSGSEIYRGLGAVIVGGLVFSTIITVYVIPSLLLFVIKDKR
ncbi:efflux RND transporter permease subunit [Helicobacter cappadocius]|uniref:Efflux RND transporter permease subunit n=1 Tax=Helicobacter cappadocius TaxID=3063998 RepID=A0AA90TF62_9HELI|nr:MULTISPECIES: efflux RND transporter permease subunit [unclassified Helicobacter]MDO7253436.1 efflux RND transporter permease subunit [Helicobacter sp. faydin-H75]MDP2539300.1 efflux RND transporter permease subunit [Helicobacter sp. faydin-H76]